MLYILFTLISAQTLFPDGFTPPVPQVCENVYDPKNCFGPAISTQNICIWDAADGLCAEESYEDMEVACGMFMEPSSCNARKFCAYNDGDLKCGAHELTAETEYQDLHMLDCRNVLQAACNEYGGMGTECGWNAKAGTCDRGYGGNFDFFCMAFDETKCAQVGACLYDAGLGCVARVNHPGGFSPVWTPGMAPGNEGGTLKKARAVPKSKLTKEIDYRFGVMVLLGLFLGVLIGTASMYVTKKSSISGSVEPVPLI